MRRVMTAIGAAVSAGVIIGLVSRMGMALVAIAAGHSSQFSLSGTASILFIYSVAMIPGALVAAFTRGPIRWLLPAAGGALLLVPAIGVASEEIGDVSGLPIGQNILLVLLGIVRLRHHPGGRRPDDAPPGSDGPRPDGRRRARLWRPATDPRPLT